MTCRSLNIPYEMITDEIDIHGDAAYYSFFVVTLCAVALCIVCTN